MSTEIRHALLEGQTLTVLFSKGLRVKRIEIGIEMKKGYPQVVAVKRDKKGGIMRTRLVKLPKYMKAKKKVVP